MLKVRFLNGVHTGGYARTFVFTGINTEFMKGGMLMKSKHCTYGKEIACSDFYDNVFRKSTIAALLAQGQLLNK